MAEPFDAATTLEDVSAIIQTEYMPEFTEESPGRFGKTTNKLFKPSNQVCGGDGLTMQYELGPADSVRLSTDALGAFHSPRTLQANSIRLRFSRTAASSDFTRFDASVQFDKLTIDNQSRQTIVDLAERVYGAVMGDYEEKLAVHRHVGRDAVIAAVNGTPKLNNGIYFGAATSTATNAGGARLQIDNGSIAAFRANQFVDFIRPATGAVIAGNVQITDRNAGDLSIGVQFNTTGITGNISTGNLANVADNDYIVFSGEYNSGLYSFGSYFVTPSAGESFIGGVDRTTSSNRWLVPTSTRQGSTSAKLTKGMFDELAIAMGFVDEDEQSGVVWLTDPTLHQAIRNELGEAAFIQIPVGDDRTRRFANFGSVGLNYQHSTFGLCKIMSDPLAKSNTVRVLCPETWRTVYYLYRGLMQVRENGAHWYRMPETAPNTGKSLIFKADWYGLQMDWCKQPWRNGQILSVSAT